MALVAGISMVDTMNNRLLAGAVALISAASLIAPTTASAGTISCNQDCISSVQFHPDGTHIAVQTTSVTSVDVLVYSNQARTQLAAIASSASSGSTTGHLLALSDVFGRPVTLNGGKRFYYKVIAKDSKGSRWETSNLTTWQRRLTLTIDKVYVMDDSDPGAGELTLDARVNGGKLHRIFTHKDISAYAELSNLGQVVVNNVGTDFRLGFVMQDDDCTFSACYMTPSMYDYPWGQSSDLQWDTATSANIHADFFGMVNNGSFDVSVGKQGHLWFTVRGKWLKEYLPV